MLQFVTLLFGFSVKPSKPSQSGGGGGSDGQYHPTPGDGQYTHVEGPHGPGAPAYQHVEGAQGGFGPNGGGGSTGGGNTNSFLFSYF